MKTTIIYLAFLSILLIAFPAHIRSQVLDFNSKGGSIFLGKDSAAKITSLNCKNTNGKTFLEWGVTGLTNNGLFIIYRSNDKKNYRPIGVKKGVGVPIPNEIAYYFIDDSARGKTDCYYKLEFMLSTDDCITTPLTSTHSSVLVHE
jgi:uncharacterized protein YjhX (UPF0386 family)